MGTSSYVVRSALTEGRPERRADGVRGWLSRVRPRGKKTLPINGCARVRLQKIAGQKNISIDEWVRVISVVAPVEVVDALKAMLSDAGQDDSIAVFVAGAKDTLSPAMLQMAVDFAEVLRAMNAARLGHSVEQRRVMQAVEGLNVRTKLCIRAVETGWGRDDA
jgi:hypothetical protein